MQWFEDWFNTSYYHVLYGNRNYEEAAFFVDNLLQHIDLPKQSRCWDLNCGKGRHSFYLNKKGYEVIGTDLSEQSIQDAKQYESDNLHFYKHDMRNLFYANYFDAVFNLFTSFGYFKSNHDDEKVFQSVYTSLKPGGLFVIDFFNAACIVANLKASDEKVINDISFHIKKKLEGNIILKEIIAEDKTGKHYFKEEVKALTLVDFTSLAEKTGFKIKHTFGNYSLQDFDVNTSERLIIIFEK
ncbi:MAG: class I SAM-dependent methyltransferase [Bacteroidia bacterium]